MKPIFHQLIGQWHFNTFPPDTVCHEAGFNNVLLASKNLRFTENRRGHADLAIIRVPLDVIYREIYKEINPAKIGWPPR